MTQIAEPIPAPARTKRKPLPMLAGTATAAARNMFGLDYRSLALLRIALGICLFWVAFTHALEMRPFYTDAGVLPRTALNTSSEFQGYSLYFLGGSQNYIATLFIAQMLLALFMLIGYRTAFATVGSFVLLVSMQNRNPWLLFGADMALRVGLFWAMFLPLGSRFSLDALAGRTRPPPCRPYLGIAGVAFIAQTCIIYAVGAMMKTGPAWRIDHTAVADALAIEAYSRPLGQWLLQFPALTKTLTIVTLYTELYGPLLFVLPIFSKWTRLLSIAIFAGMQISFGLCMSMGIFGSVMIALTLAMLPAFFWDHLAEPWARWTAQRCRRLAAIIPARARTLFRTIARACFVREWRQRKWTTFAPIRYTRFAFLFARGATVLFLFYLMLEWNLGSLPGHLWLLSPRQTLICQSVGIDQTWDMFAPEPQSIDGWFVVSATLRNGETFDMLTGASPTSYDKPASVSGSYPNQVWMSYLISFWDVSADAQPLALYLGNSWNATHTGDQQIESIEITSMETTIWPGHVRSGPNPRSLCFEWF